MDREQVALGDGVAVVIRPIRPDDRQRLIVAFERLSAESRYRRFFSSINRLTDRQLDYLTQIDHRDHEALIALTADGAAVGVARYVRTGPGEAEPAVVVADDWNGRGLATQLLTRLVDRALDEGITHFNASVLAHNPGAVAVLRHLGDTRISQAGPELELRIALQASPEESTRLRAVLRAVAAGTLDPALTFWYRMLPRSGPRSGSPPDHERANVIVTSVHDDADAAASLAGSIAAAASSEVVVVAAVHPLFDDRAAVERRTRRAVARLRALKVRAREVVRAGDLAAVLLDVAVEERARLIVVGDTSEAQGTGRLLGEPWDHISHHAPCSVLVAR